MYSRRLRYWLWQFSWFGIFAVLFGLLAVGLSLHEAPIGQVVAAGFAAVTLAILSTKET
ncbi:hypothetical protein [Longimicrobium sp.]|jgi:uncharacterized membrane protein YhaH (DUF805 family)|uniref:hypothetical protein n=1 Tax=Longimicrobium sp. TaxID=2029185 RepID=UPI002ED8F3ED